MSHLLQDHMRLFHVVSIVAAAGRVEGLREFSRPRERYVFPAQEGSPESQSHISISSLPWDYVHPWAWIYPKLVFSEVFLGFPRFS